MNYCSSVPITYKVTSSCKLFSYLIAISPSISLLWGRTPRDGDEGHGVHLLVTECTGAITMSHQLVQLLRTLSRVVGGAGNHDTTIYGTSRSSPRTFYSHHLAAVSAAIVTADAKVRSRLPPPR